MGSFKGKKPSPAMVVAIVALVFAVGGSAMAGVATISVLTKKEKKQTRSIAKREIRKAAPGLSVANSVNAQNATHAAQADSADDANSVDGLDSSAFARVVGRDTVEIDVPNLAPDTCFTAGSFDSPAVQIGDIALAFAHAQSGLVQEPQTQPFAGSLDVTLCNYNSASVDAPEMDWTIIVLR